jgi:hypothetical protein
MHSFTLITLALFTAVLSGTFAHPHLNASVANKPAAPTLNPTRRATACFVIGSTTLPAETQDSVDSIQSAVTCDTSTTTISGVPDVSSGGISFSSIDFSQSSETPLNFALSTFATATPLASSNLTLFQNQLNTYLATEAGIRSVGGSLAIKDPKFFLSFQISRILTAQGTAVSLALHVIHHDRRLI